MKDEIKEILDKLRSDDYYKKEYQKSVYYERDLKKLEDYITNLQDTLIDKQECINVYDEIIKHRDKEITNLKERCEYLQRSCERKEEQMLDYRMEYMEQEDYKSRNEKAIEYINTHYLNANEPDLLNILQGEDNE